MDRIDKYKQVVTLSVGETARLNFKTQDFKVEEVAKLMKTVFSQS